MNLLKKFKSILQKIHKQRTEILVGDPGINREQRSRYGDADGAAFCLKAEIVQDKIDEIQAGIGGNLCRFVLYGQTGKRSGR